MQTGLKSKMFQALLGANDNGMMIGLFYYSKLIFGIYFLALAMVEDSVSVSKVSTMNQYLFW
jgi:hypothetical protein